MQKTILTNTTKENANAPIFNRIHSFKDQGPPTSGYGPAHSQFQETILSELEMFSSKDEYLPQKVVYGSNPNGFRFKTLNPDNVEHQKLRSLKYLNYGFAEEDKKLRDLM